jgi:hypothetical protein
MIIKNKLEWHCGGPVYDAVEEFERRERERESKAINIISLGLSVEIWSGDCRSMKQICEVIFKCGEMSHYGGIETFV